MPSVLMSALLFRRLPVVAEVGAQRLGDQRRQRHLRLDGAVLDLLDQPGRQVHVELLDVLVAHGINASILASYATAGPTRNGTRWRGAAFLRQAALTQKAAPMWQCPRTSWPALRAGEGFFQGGGQGAEGGDGLG